MNGGTSTGWSDAGRGTQGMAPMRIGTFDHKQTIHRIPQTQCGACPVRHVCS